MMKVAIVGQGYVGLPLALAFSKRGVKTIGIERQQRLVKSLREGNSHIEDVSSVELRSALNSNLYSVSNDYSEIENVNAVIVTVPTPLDEFGNPDVSILKGAVEDIAEYVRPGTLVSIESSSYPGTLRGIVLPVFVEKSNYLNEIYFVSAPERVDPLNSKWNQKNTPRVIGPLDVGSKRKALETYSIIADEIVWVSSPEVAEATKMLENSFRLLNISFINEISMALKACGISANEVLNAASTKPYGFMRFNPGIGVGGHCIPVDPVYLKEFFLKHGQTSNLLDAALQSETQHREKIFDEIKNFLADSKCPLLIGLSYKPGVADFRESPAVQILERLRDAGFNVKWFDALITEFNGEVRSDEFSEFDKGIILVEQPIEIMERLKASSIKLLSYNLGNLDTSFNSFWE